MIDDKVLAEVIAAWLADTRRPETVLTGSLVVPAPERVGLRPPEMDDLAARVCAAWPGLHRVQVRVALGADGEPEVRMGFEVHDEAGAVLSSSVLRWRPSGRSLGERGITERGRSIARSHGPEARARLEQAAAECLALDAARATLEDTHAALAVLAARRADLADMVEAGSPTAATDLAAIAAKEPEVRAAHNDLNAERRANATAAKKARG